jgi:hypothetical protein
MEIQQVTSVAMRMKRVRARKRQGLRVYQLELDETDLIEELIVSGYLKETAQALQRAVMFLIFGKKEPSYETAS